MILIINNKEALLDYMPFGCRLQFSSPSESLIFTQNTSLYTPMSPCYPPNGLLFTLILSYGLIPLIAVLYLLREGGLWGGVNYNGWVCAGVCDAILERDIYCPRSNNDPGTQSGSRVCKGLGDRAPRSTWEYNLTNKIAILPLTHPLTCTMGLSIFADMSQFKVASTTSALLPIIPSTERTNGEKLSIARIKPACVCTSWFFYTEPTNYPFPLSSKYPRHHPQTWRQVFLLYGYPIGPGLTRHPVFLWCSLPEAPPPPICCSPSRLGVLCVRS